MVPSPCSIAEARNHLTELIREVEHGRQIEISRRGKVVAVIVSEAAFQRRKNNRSSFAKALRKFMATRPAEAVFTDREIASWRQRGPGRKVKL
jgi:prevent-host-death family protein